MCFALQVRLLILLLVAGCSHHFSTPRPDFVGQGDVRGKALIIYRGQQPVAEVRALAQPVSPFIIVACPCLCCQHGMLSGLLSASD